MSTENWRSFSPARTAASSQNPEQTMLSNVANDAETNGCQHTNPKSGNYTSVDNNVDLFSSIMSTPPAAIVSVPSDGASSHEIDSSSQLSSLQCEQESIPCIENKDCEYLKLVMGFKRTLVLPDVFFSYEMPVCYCLLCLSSSSSDHSCVKGQFQLSFDSSATI